jgi:SAM-dependent methyltransferase
MSDKPKDFSFEDHFSKQSEQYAQYRPKYPDEIYAYLASIAPARSLAWDCGTGNGQAAIGLAKYFDKVHATDASAEQISRAHPHAKVDYHVEPAEHVSLAASSVDLITVAVAIHWFSFDGFYREVKRVLKPDGILVAWTYSLTEISPEIDPLVQHYYRDWWCVLANDSLSRRTIRNTSLPLRRDCSATLCDGDPLELDPIRRLPG